MYYRIVRMIENIKLVENDPTLSDRGTTTRWHNPFAWMTGNPNYELSTGRD